MNEQTIATFITTNTRLQLLKITTDVIVNDHLNQYHKPVAGRQVKWQVRLNRKVIETSYFEYQMRKLFALYVQNITLQLTIY